MNCFGISKKKKSKDTKPSTPKPPTTKSMGINQSPSPPRKGTTPQITTRTRIHSKPPITIETEYHYPPPPPPQPPIYPPAPPIWDNYPEQLTGHDSQDQQQPQPWQTPPPWQPQSNAYFPPDPYIPTYNSARTARRASLLETIEYIDMLKLRLNPTPPTTNATTNAAKSKAQEREEEDKKKEADRKREQSEKIAGLSGRFEGHLRDLDASEKIGKARAEGEKAGVERERERFITSAGRGIGNGYLYILQLSRVDLSHTHEQASNDPFAALGYQPITTSLPKIMRPTPHDENNTFYHLHSYDPSLNPRATWEPYKCTHSQPHHPLHKHNQNQTHEIEIEPIIQPLLHKLENLQTSISRLEERQRERERCESQRRMDIEREREREKERRKFEDVYKAEIEGERERERQKEREREEKERDREWVMKEREWRGWERERESVRKREREREKRYKSKPHVKRSSFSSSDEDYGNEECLERPYGFRFGFDLGAGGVGSGKKRTGGSK